MKKRILILIDWFEPGYKAGGPIQSCSNMIKALADDFEFYILTSDRDLGDDQPYEGIPANTWINHGPNVKVYYSERANVTIATLEKIIGEVNPFCIYLNSMFSYEFTILPFMLKRIRYIKMPIIVAPRGMLQEGAIQFKYVKKRPFLSLLNILNIPSKVYFQATNEDEKADILHYFPSLKKIIVVSNFPKMDDVEWQRTKKEKGKLSCIFLSRLSPKKNLLYLLNILQLFPAGLELQLCICGENEDQAYFDRCFSASNKLSPNVQVTWQGPVPNYLVMDFYRNYHVFVLPTLGENFGHAIYEALLAGKPAIISDKTPWRGLKERSAGANISLDHPELFIGMLQDFTNMDQDQYDEWSIKAFEYAIKFRADNTLKSQYLELFSEKLLQK